MPMNPRLLVPRATFDPDAAAYLRAVEAADGQALETPVKRAVDDFFKGCKADPSGTPGRSNWDAIKASCILCGARTLAGALVPLAGTAPTNNNFVDADYNRETGLVGDGSTKYLDSGRAINADDALDQHVSVYISTSSSNTWLGASTGGLGYTSLESSGLFCGSATTVLSSSTTTGFVGVTRDNNTFHAGRRNQQTLTANNNAAVKTETRAYPVFAYRGGATIFNYVSARLAFYSIGESISDLALLDARVTALVTAIGAAL
jgi:hypothetical protein